MTNSFYLEWSSNPTHSHAFAPRDTVMNLKGFRSVYGFKEEDAKAMQELHDSSGMAKLVKYSDIMFIDFDTNPVEALNAEDYFKNNNILYELYTSGGGENNDRYHIHIPLETIQEGQDLPELHSIIIRSICSGYDKSVIRSNSLIRLAGTTHQKTKRKKTLVRSNKEAEGVTRFNPDLNYYREQLTAELATQAATTSRINPEAEDKILFGMSNYLFQMQHYPKEYNKSRTVTLWSAGEHLSKAGFSPEFVKESLYMLISYWGDDPDSFNLDKIVREACKV